ncbi:MAG: AI-2E family transporter [Gemmatimonadales bacterium]|nr:AI-2E family transporter [Gemmatimonadales bacterium]
MSDATPAARPRSVLTPDVDVTAQATTPDGALTDLTKLGDALRDQVQIRSIAITGLFVLALFYTLYFARVFILPVLLAVLLSFLFSPVVRAMRRIRIPDALGGAIIVLTLFAGIAFGAYELSGPAQEWVASAPASMAKAESKLRVLRKPIDQVSKTADQVADATNSGGNKSRQVEIKGPSLSSRLFGTTREIVTVFFEVMILLYFLLASGDMFLQKLIKVLPQFRDKKKAVTIARETEASVSTYLVTVTLINVGQGIAIFLAMLAIGMPNPALWGVLATLMEFVPYVGAVVMIGALAFAGLVTFDTPGHALVPPLLYLVVNFVQSNIVSPFVMGRRLTLNPVAIFIGLVFWLWIWGIPGAFIAVPLLATFKIFCDHIEALAPIGEFLGK